MVTIKKSLLIVVEKISSHVSCARSEIFQNNDAERIINSKKKRFHKLKWLKGISETLLSLITSTLIPTNDELDLRINLKLIIKTPTAFIPAILHKWSPTGLSTISWICVNENNFESSDRFASVHRYLNIIFNGYCVQDRGTDVAWRQRWFVASHLRSDAVVLDEARWDCLQENWRLTTSICQNLSKQLVTYGNPDFLFHVDQFLPNAFGDRFRAVPEVKSQTH